jgi:hypothetical protein
MRLLVGVGMRMVNACKGGNTSIVHIFNQASAWIEKAYALVSQSPTSTECSLEVPKYENICRDWANKWSIKTNEIRHHKNKELRATYGCVTMVCAFFFWLIGA